MNRRIWTGVVAGVLAAALLLTVGVGAYRAGQEDEVVTRVVDEPGRAGEVVRVVGDHDGPRFGFFLFPLLIILLVVLLVRAFAGHGRWHGGWRHGWGPGWHPGWHGPGPGSDPDAPGGDPRAAWFDEWHRRAHQRTEGSTTTPPTTTGTDEAPPPPTTSDDV
jgi:hypothetical protein